MITPDQNLQLHFSGYKLFFSFLIGVVGLIFASLFIFADTGSDFAAKVFPVFMLTIFSIYTLSCVLKFVQSNRPVIEIRPDGILDRRRVTSPIPWASIYRIRTRRSRHVWLVVLFMDEKEIKRLRRPYRWFRRWNKLWGFGDLAIPANGLEISQDKFRAAVEDYARANGAPAAKEWS